MDLKELLKKTQNKVDQSKSSKIRKVSIAVDDRPYDELVEFEEKNKEASEKNLKKEPLTVVPKPKDLSKVEEVVSKVDNPIVAPDINQAIDEPGPEPVKVKQKSNHSSPIRQDDFVVEDYSIVFLKLSGVEKKLVDFFFEYTKKNNTMRIGPISRDQICSLLSTNINTFKRTLRKLKDKNILSTMHHKTGKGGWAMYEFKNQFYQELISGERIKLTLREEFLEHQAIPQLQSDFAKSNITNLLPEGWENLDFEDLSEKGFTKNHLIQIYQDQMKIGKVFDEKAMQYSIDAFRYDLENNYSTMLQKSHSKSPVTFFTQILSKGRPYNSFTPEKFKTPQEIEFTKYKEKSEKIQKEFDELKSKFFDSEYQLWYKELSHELIEQILKEKNVNMDNIPDTIKQTFKVRALQEYFQSYVWIDIQKELHQKFY